MQEFNWVQFFVTALVSLVVPLIPILVLWKRQGKVEKSEINKNDAEAEAARAETVHQTLLNMQEFVDIQKSLGDLTLQVNGLRQENNALKHSLQQVECLIREWYAGIRILIGQVKQLGGSPEWEPKNIPDWLDSLK